MRLDRRGMLTGSAAIGALAAMLPGLAAPGLPFAPCYGVAVGTLDAAASRLSEGGIAARRLGVRRARPRPALARLSSGATGC